VLLLNIETPEADIAGKMRMKHPSPAEFVFFWSIVSYANEVFGQSPSQNKIWCIFSLILAAGLVFILRLKSDTTFYVENNTISTGSRLWSCLRIWYGASVCLV